ncbi:hypothetical protein ACFQOZ_14430 [Comamonas endophytica]|uniref:hypothetical protein n=1 Tax=Comamonas endophytica TaxID=2949090 RepID=UPI00360E471E
MLRIACGALFFVLAGVAQAQVYRCGSSYSHAPCKGGQVIDTAPVMSDPRGPVTKEIYLCSAAAGSSYWSSAHCAERGWRIERIERVPANMSWEEQVAAARQARESASQALAAPVQRAPRYRRPPRRLQKSNAALSTNAWKCSTAWGVREAAITT